MELTLDALEYLHDADLHSVVFDSGTPSRSVSFTATFHKDCGSKELDGRSIRVVANDITLLRAEVRGALTSSEEIDRCGLFVSEESARSLDKWINAGGRRPRSSLMLLTHSGSRWEIMCESITVQFM